MPSFGGAAFPVFSSFLHCLSSTLLYCRMLSRGGAGKQTVNSLTFLKADLRFESFWCKIRGCIFPSACLGVNGLVLIDRLYVLAFLLGENSPVIWRSKHAVFFLCRVKTLAFDIAEIGCCLFRFCGNAEARLKGERSCRKP